MYKKAGILLLSGFLFSGCSAEESVTLIQRADLGDNQVMLECSVTATESKLAERADETGLPEFGNVLSFGERFENDELDKVIRSARLHQEFNDGQEAVAFISQDDQHIAVAQFSKGLTANSFLKAANECSDAGGGMCRALVYFDGEEAVCLRLTQNEMSN